MVIKQSGRLKSTCNLFDMCGYKETGLTKAFAFLLAHNRKVLFAFLHSLGVANKNTDSTFEAIEIKTESVSAGNEGRTDIEIILKGSFHVIIEAKVRGNKITSAQRQRYISRFSPVTTNILCFITQVNDYRSIQGANNLKIQVKNMNWFAIDAFIDDKYFIEDDDKDSMLVKDFQAYIRRGFKMSDKKEILVQDIGLADELDKYKDCHVYRRDVVFGSPLYFAPYFTRDLQAREGEGIAYLSEILGIITCAPADIDLFDDTLDAFSGGNKKLVKEWKDGVRMDAGINDPAKPERTYFFLEEEPLGIKTNLLKDTDDSVNWIARMIPKNRCVSFREFAKRMQ